MSSATGACINLNALRHNLAVARKAAFQAKFMVVIKANAYGHGMVNVAQALTDADAFAVARVDEAVVLRQANIKIPIVVLSGYADKSELTICSNLNLDVVIHCEAQVELLKAATLINPLTVWLKINTGMNRLGFNADDVLRVSASLGLLKNTCQPVKLMTHLACADDVNAEMTEQQIALFDELVSGLEGEQSIVNSAGLLGWSYAQRHWVRPGIMIYGASPFRNTAASDDELMPVMTLKSTVLSLRHVKKGQRVGYGATWLATKTSLIATVGIGYGDGYPRHAASGTPILINGQRASLVGRVSMDSITVDVSGYQNVNVGDDVILWGDGLPIEEIAEASETISYDLMCGVTDRVPRHYMGAING
ncbi:MAG: alanine racemase [Piscirickettsiaceae bacterium]|nr:MAG: alanine racemase [Piscirickettsiaceae bacterium]